MGAARLAIALLVFGACDDDFFFVCPETSVAEVRELPDRLSETGLVDATGEIRSGVLAYLPRFELWSDGADKSRWISIPDGQTIDTASADTWLFPVGTKLWKEFRTGELRLETRLYQKTGPAPADWLAQSYVWDGTDAFAAPRGAIDVAGTKHDVPAAGECVACHGGRTSRILGFSAIQLAWDAPEAFVDLDGLLERGLLSEGMDVDVPIPGDELARSAVGYLHANCSHCHNQDRPAEAPCFDPNNALDFTVPARPPDRVEQMPAYQSALGDVIRRGEPASSELVQRMATRDVIFRMPPLGSERVDDAALEKVRRWIEAL